MHTLKKIIICSVFAFFVVPAFAQKPIAETNIAYIYDPKADFKIQHDFFSIGNEVDMYLKMNLTAAGRLLSQYQISYGFRKSFEDDADPDFRQLDFNTAKIGGERNTHYIHFKYSYEATKPILLVRIYHTPTQKEYFYFINLTKPRNSQFKDFLVMEANRDYPLFRNYISADDSFRIVKPGSSEAAVRVLNYRTEFGAADPPLVTQSANVLPQMEIDSSFTVMSEKILRFTADGFYFLQTDSLSNTGYSLVMTDRFYPKAAFVDDVVDPFIYLSSANENESLAKAPDRKQALDAHLLKITRSQDRSRLLVRDYFRNVNGANEYFTSYKRGWKTDKGMIYSVFGSPDEVFVSSGKEEWFYLNRAGIPRLRFSFSQIESIFTEKHHVMQRDRNYAEFWFRTVDSWRRGRQGL
jgi:GWxTD domain-containing protein